jgi:hypothetical protein
MSTGAIVAIVVGALVLTAVVVLLARNARVRRMDSRREEADELRQEAQQRGLRATRERAAADEQSARAKQAQAEAEEKAAAARRESARAQERAQVADRERRFAAERHEQARDVDPDVAEDDREGQTTRN